MAEAERGFQGVLAVPWMVEQSRRPSQQGHTAAAGPGHLCVGVRLAGSGLGSLAGLKDVPLLDGGLSFLF